MNILGVHLTILMSEAGPPRPVPIEFLLALKDVQVTHNDQGPSGFQMTFQIGRSGLWDLVDYALPRHPLLKPFNRVILLVRFAVAPEVLMDGIITNIQMNPSDEPSASTLTVTGEDVSVMMDLRQKSQSFPALSDYLIVTTIIGRYTAKYGLIPLIRLVDPKLLSPPSPIKKIPQQPAKLTDRAYLQRLADFYGYVFYVKPGPAPLLNTVYWGPPEFLAITQPALSVNMGPASNVTSINFNCDALKPEQVRYTDDKNTIQSVKEPGSSRQISLSRNRLEARKTTHLTGPRGDNSTAAQGQADRSYDSVVTVNGELDVLRYEHLLQPRGLVGLRGAGDTFDGMYYVKNVSHQISKGHYTQKFTLTREGTGTLTPLVHP